MARFTLHRVTADFKDTGKPDRWSQFVGESWTCETVWEAQDLVDKLRIKRSDLCNFKITSLGYGFD
jgi:hypothetical protein